MPRDMAIFHLFNYDSPEEVSKFKYIFHFIFSFSEYAGVHCSTGSAKTGSKRVLRCYAGCAVEKSGECGSKSGESGSKPDRRLQFPGIDRSRAHQTGKFSYVHLTFIIPNIFQLYYGLDEFQQAEHDPVNLTVHLALISPLIFQEWRGRLVIIVSVPSNGVFISALLALSPNGLVCFSFYSEFN